LFPDLWPRGVEVRPGSFFKRLENGELFEVMIRAQQL